MRGFICALVFLLPLPASAHVRLLRSDPASGSRVASPATIRLWFSERPDLALTSITLRDYKGTTFSVRPPHTTANDLTQLSFPIDSVLLAGHYTVEWRAMSSDGHPSGGRFSFTVTGSPTGVAAPNAAGAAGDTNTPVTSMAPMQHTMEASASVANSLARAATFAGILLVVGVVVFNLLIVARSNQIGSELVWRMESRAAAVGVAAGILVMIAAFARISLESQMMADMPGMATMGMSAMLLHTLWGFGMQLQLVAAFVAVIAFSIAIQRVRFAWVLASIAATALALSPAFAGHAAASARFPAFMIFTDFLHVVGGASWLGNLACVMLIGVPLIVRAGGDNKWQSVSLLVNTFSPIALASAALVVLSGIIAATVHLEKLSALWSTRYGQVLLWKVAVVIIAIVIGAYNFRRVQPQLVREEGTKRLRRSTALELTAAVLIVVITGVLTGIAP
ncbi:MAG TPA: copper resistance protein CopC [Gemmatimonadaceae bacterium]|nr:copper resistance protein CopC [Gemmatimonadaceae bacterium]